jgi:hypothetical protein
MQHKNRMRAAQQRRKNQSGPKLLTQPSAFLFDNFPESAHENFCIGNWIPVVQRGKSASVNKFNAFTFLHLVPVCLRVTQLGLPPGGLSFNLGCQLLRSILWVFELPVAGVAQEPPTAEFILKSTPFLRG